jgi:hypothetical protein
MHCSFILLIFERLNVKKNACYLIVPGIKIKAGNKGDCSVQIVEFIFFYDRSQNWTRVVPYSTGCLQNDLLKLPCWKERALSLTSRKQTSVTRCYWVIRGRKENISQYTVAFPFLAGMRLDDSLSWALITIKVHYSISLNLRSAFSCCTKVWINKYCIRICVKS